jgi:hypothetical protein
MAKKTQRKEAHDILGEENRFKFVLLSTTLLLFTFYSFVLLFFLCPGVEFTRVVSFSSLVPDERLSPEQDSAPTFYLAIGIFALVNCVTFVLHHLLRNVTFSACCFFLYVNGSVWSMCVMWGPVSEFLGALVHVPVLAFYLFGFRAGVGTLALTLGQAVVYTGTCLVGTVPTSGNTIQLSLSAQMIAVMGSYVLLGLSAAVNERSRSLAVRMYKEAHARLANATEARVRFITNVTHGTSVCPHLTAAVAASPSVVLTCSLVRTHAHSHTSQQSCAPRCTGSWRRARSC